MFVKVFCVLLKAVSSHRTPKPSAKISYIQPSDLPLVGYSFNYGVTCRLFLNSMFDVGRSMFDVYFFFLFFLFPDGQDCFTFFRDSVPYSFPSKLSLQESNHSPNPFLNFSTTSGLSAAISFFS